MLVMGKQQDTSAFVKQEIILLSQHTTMNQSEIAARCNVSQVTVSRVLRNHRCNEPLGVRRRSGRPKKTTPRVDALIGREAKKNPFITGSEIQKNLSPTLDNVTTRTITSRLRNQLRMPARRPQRKPLITEAARRKRLAWCRKYREWTLEQWKRVSFSDESLFIEFYSNMHFVRRPPGVSPYHPRYTLRTVKFAPSVMVWGTFSHHGVGALTFLPKNARMNSDMYIGVMNEKLKDAMIASNTTVYQQDGAPCHTSKKSMGWLQANGIEVLDWPGNSPDLNPIENLWQQLKVHVGKKKPTSLSHLKDLIKEAWSQIHSSKCQSLVESMPRRIQSVMLNHGYPTKY
jgi:transposase/arsenate reductase-like glutaredoxin family protein